MNTRAVAVGLVTVLLFGAVGGVFVGSVGGASEDLVIAADDPEAGSQTVHDVSIPVDDSSSGESGGSLSRVIVDYENDSATGASFDLTEVSNSTIEAIGTGGTAGSIDSSAHYDVGSVTTEQNGTKLVIDLGGNEDLTGGDYVTVRFSGVTNPARSGNYSVVGDLNPQSVDSPESGSIEIGDTTPPNVGLSLTADEQGNLDAVVTSNEELSGLNVTVDGPDSNVEHSLSYGNFTESGSVGGEWTYTASGLSTQVDGSYTATVDEATDYAGNTDPSPGVTDEATVNQNAIVVQSGNVTPASVGGGETLSQTVNVSVADASAYGGNERVSFSVNDSVVVENASAAVVSGPGSINGSVSVDNGTVSVPVDSGSGGGTVDYVVQFDVDATYVGEHARTESVDATAVDNGGEEQDSQQIDTVEVKDVTPPHITNFTLVNDGQNVDLELVADERLASGTVNLTGDAGGERSISNAAESATDGNWTYTIDVSDGVDGDFAANVTGEGTSYYVADAAGNENPDAHNDSLSVNEDAIEIVDGTVTPGAVDPGETVTQNVTVDVSKVSLDGGTDTIRVVMPEQASDVTLHGVENASGSSTTTVDNATALDATVDPGDGGGVTSVTLTYNVTATYGETLEGQTLPIDASADDSDGDEDSEPALTNISVQDTKPTITNFTLFTAGNPQDVDLRFNATEKLGSAEVGFENDLAGESNLTLGGAIVSEGQNADGTWTYTADVNEGDDGEFDASLVAADEYGNDAEGDLDATLTVNETDPVVTNATVDPRSVAPNETASQNLTASVDGFSRDGSSDQIEVVLPDGVDVVSAEWGSVDGANGGSVLSTGNHSVLLDIQSGDGLGTANVTAAFDAELRYADELEGESVPLNVTADDSDGASNTSLNETHVDVVDTNPEISNFTLNETADGVDLTFDASEGLAGVTVEIDGDTTRTLDRGDFTQSFDGGNWTYTNESVLTKDGTYNASLDAGAALDSDGNANPENHSDGVVVDNYAIDVVAANVTDEPVDPQSTVTQQVVVDVQNVSLDGESDTVDVAFNDSADATATNVSSTVGTASLTDAGNLTAEVSTGSGGGVADLTLTYNVTATYGDALEGESLAVDASATDSDGDEDSESALTNVSVRDTHPAISNFTLTNESRDVDLSFTSTEALETITVETTGDSPQSTLTRGNFTETERGGNYTYEANVSDGIDGTFDATLAAGAAVDDAGNANNESHTANVTVDTRDVTVVSATVTPDSVAPESTAEQNLTVSAENFGQDGGTDTLTLALNESLNVTAVRGETVTAGDASVDGVERLDTDGDGAAEAIRFSLDTGSGGGTTDVTAAVNATVAYPDTVEGATLAVDASAEDSDGASDEASALANVRVDDVPPTITNFSLNATEQDVDLTFEASEELTTTEVALGGDLNGTLTDLREARISEDEWAYGANVSDGEDGYFTAELTAAVDRFGNDGADGESDAVRVNAVGPKLQQTRISPDRLWPGERTNQTLTTNVTGLSRDGVNETVRYEFTNESTVELRNVSAVGANASAVVTENATTVLVDVDAGNDTGSANVTLTTNLTATYDNATEGETFNATTLVNDSLNETAGPVNTTVAVNDTVPEIVAFNLTAEGQDVNLTVTSDERLATLNASLGGDLNDTLTRENFTETAAAGNISYEANVSDGADGNVTAELTNASDPFGNNATVGQNDSIVVDTENVSVADLNVTPGEVRPNATVDATTTLNVSDLNRDGRNDTASVTFGNGIDVLAANASVDGNATVTNVSDADGDTLNETVTLAVNTTDALGTANRTLTLHTTTSYADSLEGTNVSVDATVNDSDGSNATATTNVTVVDTVPTVDAFDVALNGSAVELTMRSDEPLETVRVALSGATGGNLTRADFDATREDDGVSYTATLADGREGTFGAELAAAVDDSGNDGAAGQNGSVTVRLGGGGQQAGGGGQQQTEETEEVEVTRVDNSTDGAPLSVRVDSIEDGREIVVENAREDVDVNAHLSPLGTEAAAGVALSDVGLTTTTDGTPTLQVRHDRSATFDALPDDVDPVIAYETDGDGVTNATYTVRVTEDRLGDREPDAVEIYDADGTEIDATYTGETVDQHSYRVDAGVERFAVALSGANVTVVDAALPAANESGVAPEANPRNATVNVTLRNTGPVAGTHTVTITAANEPVVERTVEVAANSSRTIQLRANVSALNQEGPVLIEADGVDAGTIPPADERTTPSFDVDGTSTEADSPFAMATLLVVLAGAALLARRE